MELDCGFVFLLLFLLAFKIEVVDTPAGGSDSTHLMFGPKTVMCELHL